LSQAPELQLLPGSFTQTAYVCHDIRQKALQWSEAVGAGPFFVLGETQFSESFYRDEPSQERFVAAMGFMGATQIELIQPCGHGASIFGDVLQTRGEVLHHILPRIRPLSANDFDEERRRFGRAGVAEAFTGVSPIGRVVLFDTQAALGCFTELLEVSAGMYAAVAAMYLAHRSWDGTRVVRELSELSV